MISTTDLLAQLSFAATLGGFTFFAPCAFPLLPGYVAFYLGTEEVAEAGAPERLLRAVKLALLVSAGFFVVFWVLGGIAATLGSRVLSNVSLLEPVVGTLLIVLGVAMATGRSPQVHVQLPERRRSATGFFLFGIVYAVAAAGCTAPLFIAVVSRGIAGGPAVAGATLGAYGAGMAAMMIGVTGAAALGRDQILRRLSASTGRIQRTAGVLLVLAGIAQIVYYLFWLGGWQALTG